MIGLDINSMLMEESLSFGPDGARGVKRLEFDADEVPWLTITNGHKTIINAAAGYCKFGDDS